MLINYCSLPVTFQLQGLVNIFNSSQRGDNDLDFVGQIDPLVLGRRLRYFRIQAGLTLQNLADRVGKQPSYLSMVENGHREPTLSLINQLASALETDAVTLLSPEPPDHRARLEIDLERAQRDKSVESLELPYVKASSRIPDQMLELVLGLYGELKRLSQIQAATPGQASIANASLRAEMRSRDNYFSEIETAAAQALKNVDYAGAGAVPPRLLTRLASHFGFTVHQVQDLPSSARSITDLRHRRIYIPQRDELRTRAARSVVLQTLGHFALGHSDPRNFEEFLRQRVEANYFAGAILVPEDAAVEFLNEARRLRDLSVEDVKELFYVSYEMAAHRFTNLATHHLDIPVHFARSDEQGVIWKSYENDGVPFPEGPSGAIEGRQICRYWGARQVFRSEDRFSIHYQYTDTPKGTFWCATHLVADREPHHAVTIGVDFDHARFFRGSDTDRRSASECPDPACCQRPPPELSNHWRGQAWPSPRVQSHVLATLPTGTFPGVDLTAVYEFLETQATSVDQGA